MGRYLASFTVLSETLNATTCPYMMAIGKLRLHDHDQIVLEVLETRIIQSFIKNGWTTNQQTWLSSSALEVRLWKGKSQILWEQISFDIIWIIRTAEHCNQIPLTTATSSLFAVHAVIRSKQSSWDASLTNMQGIDESLGPRRAIQGRESRHTIWYPDLQHISPR